MAKATKCACGSKATILTATRGSYSWECHPCRAARETADEFERAAEWCADRGLSGKFGDPLPVGLSTLCHEQINRAPEVFEARVRSYAYALAMGGAKDYSDTPEAPAEDRLADAAQECFDRSLETGR